MAFLLDVSVVIALLDRTHVEHILAHDWFAAKGSAGWATCPITENGVVRIMSQPSYPNAQASPAAVAIVFRQFCGLPGHEFWPDDLSLTSSTFISFQQLRSPRQVTDTYLLGLAASRGGKLATLDRRLSPIAVPNGGASLELIT